MPKRTALYSAHQRLGARLIDFGGWEMPVQYSGIVEEHLAVRNAAGLFDISHMGQLLISGAGALTFLNGVLTNDARRLEVGQGQYTLLCNEQGGVVDDLYLYRLTAAEYLLIVNASRFDADHAWLELRRQAAPDPASVRFENVSASHGALAVQGPSVIAFLGACFSSDVPGRPGRLDAMRKNEIISLPFQDARCHVARTGYTGEDGFEIFGPVTHLESLWNQLLAAGQAHGLKPCGLGARDTLRTEMGYPLYGHELDEHTTPIEAGLGFFVALDKGEFVGRTPLLRQKQSGVSRKCVALLMAGSSPPPRPGYPIRESDATVEPVGRVTSGTQSPSLGRGIGLGYVPPRLAKSGTTVAIEIRGRHYAASVVPKPIYRRPAEGAANGVPAKAV
jgi:aminomethyltransferase